MKSTKFPTAIGECLISWDEKGVTGFELPGFQTAVEIDEQPPAWIESLITKVQQHLAGQMQDFSDVNYDFDRVTPFQKEVYRAALTVPAGEYRTYGWLAAKVGRDSAASRAIGGALGRNPWPLLIPCHRFVGANGKLTGFSAAGGVETKRRLLDLEESATGQLFMAAAI
jgi:methylated-DNA-[protein]-cysteine S-methyltransferase